MGNTGTPWTGRQWEFIKWYATPTEAREPRNQGDFAKSIGVNKNTLVKWKQKPGFYEEVNAIGRDMFKESMRDIFAAHILKAMEGDVPAIRLAYEMGGEISEDGQTTNVVVEIKGYAVREASPDAWDDG